MKDELAPEDEDVASERVRLQNSMSGAVHSAGNLQYAEETDQDAIRIEGLRKVYPGKTAVKDVWFGVPVGQIFGFLGVNGAGNKEFRLIN